MSDIVTIRGFAATRPELRALPSGVPQAGEEYRGLNR